MMYDNESDTDIAKVFLSVKELESAIAFAKRHNESQLMMEVDNSGSIGQKISISCHDGSSKVDITEYDRW